jgi:hypothetical protein
MITKCGKAKIKSLVCYQLIIIIIYQKGGKQVKSGILVIHTWGLIASWTAWRAKASGDSFLASAVRNTPCSQADNPRSRESTGTCHASNTSGAWWRVTKSGGWLGEWTRSRRVPGAVQ